MTGIFFRIERTGRWQSVELDDMTAGEIRVALDDQEHGQLIRVICMLVAAIQEVKDA